MNASTRQEQTVSHSKSFLVSVLTLSNLNPELDSEAVGSMHSSFHTGTLQDVLGETNAEIQFNYTAS